MVDPAGSPTDSGKPFRERRAVPRFSLIAAAEIIEPVSGVRISGRVSEVSRRGCYIDLLNTLPTQTLIQVRIMRDLGTFETPGKIIYTQEGMGMGVGFFDTLPDQLKILDSWIGELNDSEV
ncbi:MAG TPA: PilZ domain-containing protein [Candidatus Acidoferrales bacterium]|nr:PilZ domain-containing protein [Candidatus Acidoferrales bacterium]